MHRHRSCLDVGRAGEALARARRPDHAGGLGLGHPGPKFVDAVNKQFTKLHPNIRVKRVTQPFNSYFTLLKSAVVAKRGPDIFSTYATAAVFDNEKGLLPLSKYVTAKQRTDLLGWGNVSGGKTPYAVPMGGSGTIFYYNKALFAKAGPRIPTRRRRRGTSCWLPATRSRARASCRWPPASRTATTPSGGSAASGRSS